MLSRSERIAAERIGKDLDKSPDFYLLSADQGRIFRKATEGFGALAAAILGVQFILVGFDPSEPIYLPLSQVASGQLWGMLMFFLGLTRIIVLIVNGWWPLGHRVRKWLSVGFIFGVWAPLLTCFWWTSLFELFSAGLAKPRPGLAYSLFAVTIELLIFYAHTSYVYAVKERFKDD